MWSTGMGQDGPDDDFLRRVSAPENEIPVGLPTSVVLARTDVAAVALFGLQVYTTGVAFTLVIRVRPSSRLGTGNTLNELVWGQGAGEGRFLLGIAETFAARQRVLMTTVVVGGMLVWRMEPVGVWRVALEHMG